MQRIIFVTSAFLMASNVVYAQAIPSGIAIDPTDILDITESFGGFLLILGGILAAIVVIGSGIYYLSAGADSAKVKTAKDILKAGIIGAFIIFGVGIIINTVKIFAEDPLGFFR